MKKYLIILVLGILCITGCGNKELLSFDYTTYVDGERTTNTFSYYESKKATNYVLLDTIKGYIAIELNPTAAPQTVSNFKKLVKEEFYSNITFHRVIQNFMIQTGDPSGTGSGGSGTTIKGEFSANGFDNPLSHTRGAVSMARTSDDYDSGSSQFFIVQKDSTELDGQYAVFGNVIAGLEVVDTIASVQTTPSDRPIVNQIIRSIKFIELQK